MVEQQAIGRVVRLGQQSPVVITRYIMKGTVEEVFIVSQYPFYKYSINILQECSVPPRL